MRLLVRKLTTAALVWGLLVCGATAQTVTADQAERARLREDLDRLEAQLAAVKARLTLLESASPSPAPAPVGQVVADDAQEFQSRTGPISGYMDFHFNKRR